MSEILSRREALPALVGAALTLCSCAGGGSALLSGTRRTSRNSASSMTARVISRNPKGFPLWSSAGQKISPRITPRPGNGDGPGGASADLAFPTTDGSAVYVYSAANAIEGYDSNGDVLYQGLGSLDAYYNLTLTLATPSQGSVAFAVPAISSVPLNQDYVVNSRTLHINSATRSGTIVGKSGTATFWLDASNNLKASQSGHTYMVPAARLMPFGSLTDQCALAILVGTLLIAAIVDMAIDLIALCVATGPLFEACAMAVISLAYFLIQQEIKNIEKACGLIP